MITEHIEYKLLSHTYKVLTTTQPSYLHNLIRVQPPHALALHRWSHLLVHLPARFLSSLKSTPSFSLSKRTNLSILTHPVL